MSASDPRSPIRNRLPKQYSDNELAFLKSHLPYVLYLLVPLNPLTEPPTHSEFERRSQGSIRGDAKKFALERATEFISTFGLPDEYQGVSEPEPRFREQIYNWYKNTIGRTRRKLEGRPRSSKKAAEKAAQNNITWPTNLASPTTVPYSQVASPPTAVKAAPVPPCAPAPPPPPPPPPPPQYGGSYHNNVSPASSGPASHLTLNINVSTLRDAFMTQQVDAHTLSSMIQTFVMSNASSTPLTMVVQALFEAISAQEAAQIKKPHTGPDASSLLLRRFIEVCAHFPPTIVHANVEGPLSGPRALQMAIRKTSVWTPIGFNPNAPSLQLSMTHEMERIAQDRQRRKDYIQWAKVHAAALELGMLGVNGDSNGQFVSGRSFSEVMARDSVWQDDEVEWCAGICVLRAIIRTGLRGGPGQRREYEELLQTYESRWKEIKDEARQALVTVSGTSSFFFPIRLSSR